MSKKIGIILATLHFISVVFVGWIITTSTHSDVVMVWLFYLTIDFPVAYLMVPLAYVVDFINPISSVDQHGNYSVFRDIENFWYPAVFVGIVGTAWWYYLPSLITKLIKSVRGKIKSN